MKIFKKPAAYLVLITIMFFTSVDKGLATEEDNWRFAIEPYFMATSIEGDTSVGRAAGVNVDVSFSDIVETLEAAFMIRAESNFKTCVVLKNCFMKFENPCISLLNRRRTSQSPSEKGVRFVYMARNVNGIALF